MNPLTVPKLVNVDVESNLIHSIVFNMLRVTRFQDKCNSYSHDTVTCGPNKLQSLLYN